MGLDFAIDALYDTGWNITEVKALARHSDGRPYPSRDAVQAFFGEHGYELNLKHIQLFDCYRAEWRDADGKLGGAVVGQTAEEAAVYAMSQLRRQLANR